MASSNSETTFHIAFSRRIVSLIVSHVDSETDACPMGVSWADPDRQQLLPGSPAESLRVAWQHCGPHCQIDGPGWTTTGLSHRVLPWVAQCAPDTWPDPWPRLGHARTTLRDFTVPRPVSCRCLANWWSRLGHARVIPQVLAMAWPACPRCLARSLVQAGPCQGDPSGLRHGLAGVLQMLLGHPMPAWVAELPS